MLRRSDRLRSNEVAMFFRPFRSREAVAVVFAAMLALAPGLAQARAGGGFSFGSRGGRTFFSPRITSTVPGGAAPIRRSMTRRSPRNFFQPMRQRRFGFGSPFSRGLLGGLIGAGFLGLLFGHGFFGGLGGGMSLIGLLLQLGLIYLALRWVMSSLGRRPALTFGAGAARSGWRGYGLGGGRGGVQSSPLTLEGADFNAFEYLLGAIETAYGAENLERLRSMVTPEMASYFAEQIADNARQGVVNEVSNVHLLKGDLAEAWSEPDADYATVALRFSLIDVRRERVNGRIVAGDSSTPVEAAEIWTFRRLPGSGSNGWQLSAIQQAQ